MAQFKRMLYFVLAFIKFALVMSLFLYNCITFSVDYFNYNFDVNVAPYVPMTQPVPGLSICFTLTSLFTPEVNRNFFPLKVVSYTNKKIGEIMSKAPRVDDVIKHCAYRNFSDDTMIKLSTSEACNEYFSVQQFRLNGYVCYRLTPPHEEYTLYSISFATRNRRMLYKLSLKDAWSTGYTICPMIQMSGYTSDNRLFNQEMLPSNKINQSFVLTYHLYNITRLPPPYSTRCSDLQSHHRCYSDCMSRGYKNHGLSNINSETSDEDSSLVLPDYISEYNGSSRSDIRARYQSGCASKCKQTSICRENMTVTEMALRSMKGNQKLTFTLETLSHPPTRMQLIPSLPLIEFITALASVAGIVYGFSVLHLFQYRRKVPSIILERRLNYLIKISLVAKRTCAQMLQNSMPVAPIHQKQPKRLFKLVKKHRLNIIHICFMILVASLFSYQVYNVNHAYFEYTTLTKLKFDTNPLARAPNVSVCFQLETLLFPPNAKFILSNRTNYDEVYKFRAFNYTMRQIMEKAWPVDQILQGCRLRDKGRTDWAFYFHPLEGCLKSLRVSLLYIHRHLCYQFNLIKEIKYTQAENRFRSHDSGLHFSLVFTDFLASKYSRLVFTFYSKLPIVSSNYGIFHKREEGRHVYLVSTFRSFVKKLPPPYDTRCSMNNGRAGCYNRCVIAKTLQQIDQLAFGAVIDKPIDKRPLNYIDLRDHQKSMVWFTIEKLCAEICDQDPCQDDVVKTYISPGYQSNFTFEYAIDSHKYPDVHTTAIEKMTFFQYFFQIQCCISFWLGVAASSLISITSASQLDSIANSKIIDLLEKILKIISSTERILFYYWPILLNQRYKCRAALKRYWLLCMKKRFQGRPLNIILFLSCAVCCSCQLYYNIYQYIQYPTTMYTMSEMESNSSYFDLTVCVRLPSHYSRDDGSSSDNSNGNETASQILQSVNHEYLLNGCGYRGLRPLARSNNLTNRIYFYENDDHTFCNSLFQIESFLLQNMLCHKFHERYPLNKTSYEDMHALNWPKMQYSVVLNRSELSDHILLILYEYDGYPYYSSIFSPTIKHIGSNIWFIVSYVRYKIESLPFPYSPGDFTDVLHFWCFDRCMNRAIQPYGFHTPGLIYEPVNLRLIQTHDKQNVSFGPIYSQAERDCLTECFDRSTAEYIKKHSLMVTNVNSPSPSSVVTIGESVEIFVRTTDHPIVMLTFKAKFSLFELFITLGSILGIWFGFSAPHCDPSKHLILASQEKMFFVRMKLETCLRDLIMIKSRMQRIHF